MAFRATPPRAIPVSRRAGVSGVRVSPARIVHPSVRTSAASENDFFSTIKFFAKKVQGALPIVGLLSRIVSPDNGFDELAYPEFSRSLLDNMTPECRDAFIGLDKKYGKMGNSRYSMLVLWMAKLGPGIVPSKDIVMGMRRLRISQDLEAEIDRFSNAREAAVKKFDGMAPPEVALSEKLNVALDGISTLWGLKDGQDLDAGDTIAVASILRNTFAGVSDAEVSAAINGRAARATAYM